jgi:ABC-type multidrug transport system ATPase subunit
MLSDNLTMTGSMKVNGVNVPNIEIISNQIAYVMQDDILLATFTPRG